MTRSVDDRLAEALREWVASATRPTRWNEISEDTRQHWLEQTDQFQTTLATLGLEVRDKPNRDHDEPPTGAWGDLQAYGKKGESDE